MAKKTPQPEQLPLLELRRIGQRVPQTAFEMRCLEAWASIAIQRERQDIPDVIQAVIRALPADQLLLGEPAGLRAAKLLAHADAAIRGRFLEQIRLRIREPDRSTILRELELSSDQKAASDLETLTLWILEPPKEPSDVVEAIRHAIPGARIDERYSNPRAGEFALVIERSLGLAEALAYLSALSSQLGAALLTPPASEGGRGPNAILTATPYAPATVSEADFRTCPPSVVTSDPERH